MKLAWILVAVAALSGGAWFYNKQMQAKTAAGANAALALERATTAVAESRNIRFTVSAAGEITPAEQVSVRPEIPGKISALPVDLGDFVKKGEMLFSLDDRDLQTERESQDKAVERAKVELAQAERNYERHRNLHDNNLVSQEVFEEQRTKFELAKNTLSREEKAREQVVDKLRKTRITAPFDCTVLTRPVSVGQAVSGSAGFNSGTEVLTIADLNQLIINAHINQADITRLKVNQEVEVAVEAIQGLKVNGLVERIAPQATIKNNIKGFSARIALKNVDPRIRPSMTANIKIPVYSLDNVLAVPLASIFTELNQTTQQMERFVYVKNEAGYERRPVQIGVSDYFYAEVQQGLNAGDVVSLEEPKEEAEKRNKAKTAALPAPVATPAKTPATASPSGSKTNATRTVTTASQPAASGS